jgi:hypothetical protein
VKRAGRAWRRLGATAKGALLCATAVWSVGWSAGWSAGCSWVLTQPLPDSWERNGAPVCSTSLVPPVVDSLFFLTNTGGAIYVATQDANYKALAIAAGLVEASIWMASAIYGYSKTSACQSAIHDFQHGYEPPAFGTGGEVFTPPQPAKPDAPRSAD